MKHTIRGKAMDETPDIRRKRLLFRSWHRGTREADLMLGPFADHHLAELSPDELDRYEDLLAENDGTLYDWISGRVALPPERASDAVLLSIIRFCGRPRTP